MTTTRASSSPPPSATAAPACALPRWSRNSSVSAAIVLFLVAADWKPVEQALGRAGSEQPGGVYRVSFPRSDLTVTAGGVTIKPALALGSWAAFRASDGHAMAMGDLVLIESEIDPVIDALQQGGIEPSAVH